jgi:hypothetical protein
MLTRCRARNGPFGFTADLFPVIRSTNPTDVTRNGASTIRGASNASIVWLI